MDTKTVGISAAIAVAAIIGLATTVGGSGGPASVPASIPAGAIKTDLSTAPVVPDSTVVAYVNLPEGYRLVGGVTLTGAAIGAFEIIEARQDGISVSVKAKNISKKTLRFTADIHYQN